MSLKCFAYKIAYAHPNNQTVHQLFCTYRLEFKKENQTTQDQNIEDNLDL